MAKINQRQRKFAINYFKTGNATKSAINAGYAPKFARNNVPKLLQNTTIQEYLSELNERIESPAIADVTERKRILSDIARSEHRILVTPKEITDAIAELNKMEGDYASDKHTTLGQIHIEVVCKDSNEH